MGNHEFCEDCGESDFHLHRPCDPKKVAARKAEAKKQGEEQQQCIGKMKLELEKAGIKYRLDRYGNAIVSYSDFKVEPKPEAPRQVVSVKVYDAGGLDCQEKLCPFRRECAIHETAGDFRSEDGFTPELTVEVVKGKNQFSCATILRASDEERDEPCNMATLNRGSLSFHNGEIQRSGSIFPE